MALANPGIWGVERSGMAASMIDPTVIFDHLVVRKKQRREED
jgi:hypothetical protein